MGNSYSGPEWVWLGSLSGWTIELGCGPFDEDTNLTHRCGAAYTLAGPSGRIFLANLIQEKVLTHSCGGDRDDG